MKGFLEKTEKATGYSHRKPYGKLRTLTKAHKLNFILIGLLPFIFGEALHRPLYPVQALYFDMHLTVLSSPETNRTFIPFLMSIFLLSRKYCTPPP